MEERDGGSKKTSSCCFRNHQHGGGGGDDGGGSGGDGGVNGADGSRTFGERCGHLAKKQRAKFYILRRCIAMLVCWHERGDH